MLIESHQYTRKYDGPSLKDDLQLLSFQLKGKPDNQSWRSLFEEKGLIPIAFNGRIFSKNHLLDFYKMQREKPELVKMMQSNFTSVNYNGVPPLEMIIQ